MGIKIYMHEIKKKFNKMEKTVFWSNLVVLYTGVSSEHTTHMHREKPLSLLLQNNHKAVYKIT